MLELTCAGLELKESAWTHAFLLMDGWMDGQADKDQCVYIYLFVFSIERAYKGVFVETENCYYNSTVVIILYALNLHTAVCQL